VHVPLGLVGVREGVQFCRPRQRWRR
jgi:hypothetical protein